MRQFPKPGFAATLLFTFLTAALVSCAGSGRYDHQEVRQGLSEGVSENLFIRSDLQQRQAIEAIILPGWTAYVLTLSDINYVEGDDTYEVRWADEDGGKEAWGVDMGTGEVWPIDVGALLSAIVFFCGSRNDPSYVPSPRCQEYYAITDDLPDAGD